MKEPLEPIANRLGITSTSLNDDQLDRLAIVEHAHANWERKRKVRFVLCGEVAGEEVPVKNRGLLKLIAGFFKMTTTTDPAQAQLCRRIARQLGLEGKALLPKHESIIAELATIVGAVVPRPLLHVSDAQLPRVRELVASLPRTIEVEQYLDKSSDGAKWLRQARF
jgi:hypothetical protein